MDYVDLYIMHFPIAFSRNSTLENVIIDWELTDDPYPTWKAMEELLITGKVRNIGVSK